MSRAVVAVTAARRGHRRRASRLALAFAVALGLLSLPGLPGVSGPVARAAPPELDTDPFRPPPGRGPARAEDPAKPKGPQRWYLRPTVGFVARFAPNRRFLPKEGFGFAFEAGAVLGEGLLRLALGLSYGYDRVARSIDIYVGSSELTSCTMIRSAAYHQALGQAFAWMDFKPVSLWFGLSGGFVHGTVRSPKDDCSSSGKEVPHGTIGPDFGIAYQLRPDLTLGVYLRSRHFFSKKRFESPEGETHPVFYPLLTTGLALTLRF